MPGPRILYISHSSTVAGAEKNLLAIIANAHFGGFEPAALVLPEPGALADEAKILSIPLRFVSYHAFRWYHPFRYIQTLWALRRHAMECEADIIHLNLQILAEFAVQTGRLTGLPVVCHVRNLQTKRSLARLSAWLNRTDAVLAVSQAVQDSLVGGGIAARKVHLCYESVDTKYFGAPNRGPQLARSRGLSPCTQLIGFIGRVVYEKGVEDLIAASKQVLAVCPETHVFIVGDDGQGGKYMTELREKVARSGLEPNVTFLGFRTDVREILNELDVVVVPSRSTMREGLPYSVLESLATGRVVIATRNSGVPEVIRDGVNGFMVDCNDIDGLASAMTYALELPQAQRKAMETAATRSVEDRTVENQVRQLGYIYRQLLLQRSQVHGRRSVN